jgi:tetratricopeptide (TPR) repeat protein
MKKIINLILIIISTSALNGQQTVDYLMRARALTEKGNPDAAIAELSKAISVANDCRLYTERAAANILKGNYQEGINDCNAANRITPFSGEYDLARIYALKGDPKTALYHLEQNLGSTFRKGERDIMLDPAFGSVENTPEWRQFWKKEWYTGIEKKISELEYYLASGMVAESNEALAELKQNYPGNDEVKYAEVLTTMSSGKYPDAVKLALELTDKNPVNEKYLRILGRVQTAASNPAGASITYSRLLESGLADAGLLLLRADCYRKTGEYNKALTDINKYLEIYPASKSGLSTAGKIEAASGDNISALKYFTENVNSHPSDAECYLDRANSYFVSKSWEWAINDYSMSLDLNPTDSGAWLNKGISLINSGRTEDACHDLRKSFSLGNKRASEYISRYCIK